MKRISILAVFILCSQLSVFAQQNGKCDFDRKSVPDDAKTDTIIVEAQKIANVRFESGGKSWLQFANTHKSLTKRINYNVQVVLRGCTDTLIIPSADKSNFAFTAGQSDPGKFYKMRFLVFPNTYKENMQKRRIVVLDKIMEETMDQ